MLILFSTVFAVHLLALMSPGPDFFFISQTAMSRSRKEAMMGVLGITLGVLIWAAIALMGLHFLLVKMTWLHQVITIGGGGYLCWMGWQLIKSAQAKNNSSKLEVNNNVSMLPKRGKIFIRGLLTNLSNPKSVIYFGSIFSLFVGNSVDNGQRWELFAMISLETLGWFSLVALVFALPVMRRTYERLSKWIDGVAGVLFVGIGIHLIISS